MTADVPETRRPQRCAGRCRRALGFAQPAADFSTSGRLSSRIYLLGGYPSGDRLREYDPVSNGWSSRTAPPSVFNWGFASAVVGDALFAFGGEAGATTNGAGYRYDFATDTWLAVASIPLNHGRGALSAAAVGDRIYVLNGNQDDGTTVLQIYDTVANTWSQGAVLAGHTAVPSHGR